MSPLKHTFTVFGATGNQGSAVCRGAAAYLGPDSVIRAVTRDPTSAKTKKLLDSMKVANGPKFEAIKADLDSPQELKAAIEGADVVFLNENTFMAPDREIPRAQALIDAAVESSTVRLFIWSHLPSIKDATKGKYSHVIHFDQKAEVTKYLQKKSDETNGKMAWSAVGLGWFAENLLDYHLVQPTSEDGKSWNVSWNLLKPDVKLPWTWVSHDVAETTKALLHSYDSSDKKLLNRIVHACGTKPTMEEFVAEIKKQTGFKDVTYTPRGSMGSDEMDQMVLYYNEYGLYKEVDLPEKDLVDNGAQLTTLSSYVQQVIVPFMNRK